MRKFVTGWISAQMMLTRVRTIAHASGLEGKRAWEGCFSSRYSRAATDWPMRKGLSLEAFEMRTGTDADGLRVL